MRVQAGTWRGRRLLSLPGERVRPTADRTRQALFNILAHGLLPDPSPSAEAAFPAGAQVLDAFAGTGALGIEALSRGAAHATFLDRHPDSLRLVQANLETLAAAEHASLVQRDACRPGAAPCVHDLALLDPPYHSDLGAPALAALAEAGWLGPGAIAVVETAAGEKFMPPERFRLLEERRYGAARLWFLRHTADTL